MASDEVVWNIINGNGGASFCSFRLKMPHTKDHKSAFCRNEMNHSGLCNRQSCPLANSRYATIREEQGKLYLYLRTVERMHLPSKMWEKRLLSRSYNEALSQIDNQLIYWPKYIVHRCKQRLTRLTQVQIRMRRIAAEEERLGEKLVPKMAPKIKHREQARERKAEAAAKLERTIERELVERLRQGAYGDQPLNVSEHIWKKVLNAMEREGQGERDADMDKGLDENGEEAEWSEEDDNLENQVEYVSDIGESDDELGDLEEWLGSDEEDEENEDEDDSEESESEKAGNKRKRGRAIKMKNKKPRQQEKEKLMLTNDLSW